MKLQQLRYLAAVVETGSITDAAKRCNVSQPALSAGLASLEAELGGPLIERERGSSRLTPLGARFHRRALRILNECEAARIEFQRGLTRSFVKIGLLPTISMDFMLDALRRFSAAVPEVELRLREGDGRTLLSWLSSGRVDAALTISDVVEGGGWVPLYTDPLALVCSPEHPFAGRPSIRLADLDREPFVLRRHCERGREACDILEARGVRLNVVLRTDQDRRALEAVEARIGVTIAPVSLVGDAVTVPIEDLGLVRTVGIHLGSGLDEAVAGPLVAALREAAERPGYPAARSAEGPNWRAASRA